MGIHVIAVYAYAFIYVSPILLFDQLFLYNISNDEIRDVQRPWPSNFFCLIFIYVLYLSKFSIINHLRKMYFPPKKR